MKLRAVPAPRLPSGFLRYSRRRRCTLIPVDSKACTYGSAEPSRIGDFEVVDLDDHVIDPVADQRGEQVLGRLDEHGLAHQRSRIADFGDVSVRWRGFRSCRGRYGGNTMPEPAAAGTRRICHHGPGVQAPRLKNETGGGDGPLTMGLWRLEKNRGRPLHLGSRTQTKITAGTIRTCVVKSDTGTRHRQFYSFGSSPAPAQVLRFVRITG